MKKILIWGTGTIAKRVLANGLGGELIGFIETEKRNNTFMGLPVYEATEIPDFVDIIIVANACSDEIYQVCIRTGIDLNIVVFMVRGCLTTVNNKIEDLDSVLGERNYIDYQIQYGIKTNTFVDADAKIYKALNQRKNFDIQDEYMWPIISDKHALNGAMGNYFWQDLWAAKKVINSGVREHYDIGSRVDGFISHCLAAGIKVNVIDIRPFSAQVDNLLTIIDDATTLSQFADNSILSMSALCSLEHFGLGRYGDPIDPEACFKCFDNIQKKLKKDGRLYLSLPIGKERVEFNAHRIFYASTVLECFRTLKLQEFSCAFEGRIEYNVEIHKYDNDLHNGEYRYGLFYFMK
ncbi:MAG: DUF268 domain-containing protein [Lachnospiraceae bacterium]|nr:DUF268 domain-containing protein [Lachnospiraceae bacterium]